MVTQQGGVHDPENFERLACLHKIHPTPHTFDSLRRLSSCLDERASERLADAALLPPERPPSSSTNVLLRLLLIHDSVHNALHAVAAA